MLPMSKNLLGVYEVDIYMNVSERKQEKIVLGKEREKYNTCLKDTSSFP